MPDCEKGIFKQVPADALHCVIQPVQTVWQSPATATVGDWVSASFMIVSAASVIIFVLFAWIGAIIEDYERHANRKKP